MQVARQLGFVPPEVASVLRRVEGIVSRIDRTWPDVAQFPQASFDSIFNHTHAALELLDNRIIKAARDSQVAGDRMLLAELNTQHQHLEAAMANLKTAAREATHDDVTGYYTSTAFPTAVTDAMKTIVRAWKISSAVHDRYLSWLDGMHATEIQNNVAAVQRTIALLPGARPPLTTAGKVGLAVGLVAVLGGLGFLFYRQFAPTMAFAGHDDEDDDEEEYLPTGIHYLTSGSHSDDYIDAEIVEEVYDPHDKLEQATALMRDVLD